MPDLRRAALALVLGAATACGDDGGTASGSEDDDGETGTGGSSDTDPATTTGSGTTSGVTTIPPTSGPDWTTGEASMCVAMDGNGPCYVESLIPIPSVNLVYGDFDGDDELDFAVVDDSTGGGSPDAVLLYAGGNGASFDDPVALEFDPVAAHESDPASLGALRLMRTASGVDRIFVQGTYGSLGDTRIDVWWIDGGGFMRFYDPTQTPPAGPWFGDFDGSGEPDLAFAPMGSALNPLDVHPCDAGTLGCAGPQAFTVTGAPDPPWTLLTGELTGDARADVLVVQRSGTAGNYTSEAVVLEATAGGFTAGAAIPLGPDRSGSNLWLAELTGDDALDLLIASDLGDTSDDENGRHLTLFSGDGAGGFSETSTLDAEIGVRGLDIADFDGDDLPDLVARRTDTEVLDIYIGDGTGFALGPRYQIAQIPTGNAGDSIGPWPTKLADLDDDGVADVLTVVRSDDGLAVSRLIATEQ